MRGPGNLHGLPWPEGDPEALRGAANRLAGRGGALEGFAGRVNGISQPAGWAGEGASSFQAASGQQARMMNARGGELRGGAGALNSLSVKLEDAQQTVTDWATRVGEAKRVAREATQRAEAATEDARQARAMAEDPLVKPLGAFNPLEGIAEVAEGKAADARDRATQAAEDLERIRRRAEEAAREANGDVRSADGAVAAQIDSLGGEFGIAMGAPVPTATTAGGGTVPISAMAALGRFLGGLGGRSGTSHAQSSPTTNRRCRSPGPTPARRSCASSHSSPWPATGCARACSLAAAAWARGRVSGRQWVRCARSSSASAGHPGA